MAMETAEAEKSAVISKSAGNAEEVPCVSAHLPGAGGSIRTVPEDFEVEEIPAYEPCGEGSHLFLWVEKRNLTTRDAVLAVSRALKVPEREVGYAGMKDCRALTRQFLSVPADGVSEAVLSMLASEDFPLDEGTKERGGSLKLLRWARHGNKLRTGHLRGNRFAITLRGTVPDGLERARAICEHIAAHGLPNAYGSQRFGRDGMNAVRGRALILGERTPEVMRLMRDRFLRRLSVSACQSLLFNRVLARRMDDGLFETAIAGDLMKKLDTGGMFLSEDAVSDTERVRRFAISPTGPIFGHRMMQASLEAKAREDAVLAEAGLNLDAFRHLKGDAEGSRRPLRIFVSPVAEALPVEGAIRLTFALPKGAFATVLLREVMKAGEAASLPEQLDEA